MEESGRAAALATVELDSEEAQPLADGGPDGGGVFADTGGEDERVEAAQRGCHPADSGRNAVGELRAGESNGSAVRRERGSRSDAAMTGFLSSTSDRDREGLSYFGV